MWSWLRRRRSNGDPNAAAARILTALLDGTLTAREARAQWPSARVSEPSAQSFLDYFEQGLDGRGLRDPSIDRIVRNLVTILECGGPAQWNERTEGWNASGAPVDRPREPRDAYLRMCISALAVRRVNAEANRDANEATAVAAEANALGKHALEPKELAVMTARFGAVPRSLHMELHWRVEAVGALAWALELIDAIPPPDARTDYERLEMVVPRTASAIAAALETAALRPVDALLEMRARLRKERIATLAARSGHEQDRELSFHNSRALERYRALQWLVNRDAPSLEATPATPGE